MFENSKGLGFLLLAILKISLYVSFIILKILTHRIIDKKRSNVCNESMFYVFNALENVRLHIQFKKTFIIIY